MPPSSLPSPLVVSPTEARRFLRRAHRLEAAFPDAGAALAYHGYIQIDPINVCGRMHDLILRNRVAGYREGDLMRHLHGGDEEAGAARQPKAPEARRAFEHHLPQTGVLVAFTLDAWPHLHAAMRRRARGTGAWSGRLTPREKVLAGQLLAEIAARGPLGSEDFEDDRVARKVWGAARLVKATLQKLFFHGRLLIAQRVHNRRRYDLPERVLPAAVLAQPEATPAETARWLALLKLRQRRLATLTREELRHAVGAVQPVKVEGCPPLYCLAADAEGFEAAAKNPASSTPVALLAPLDPLVYDRRVTKALWGFDYTWEVYTPPHKRVRGYYALPILAGTELVGHLDLKAERPAGRLLVQGRRVRRGHAAGDAVRDMAHWLGLRSVRRGLRPAASAPLPG